ncbi:MAG: DUF503 domain-containing protein [Acidobacteria bacterium]|nr:DUF503 domain-containing protein [Acidobacteriota bacterium]MCZ6833427.1 DUF503 domain-containing protein [Acidobacteriota bacterium]
MVVGVIRVELLIHGSSSLKEKRAVLRKIKDRTRARHNISVAEVEFQDLRQRAVLGFAAVSHNESDLQRLFNTLRNEVEGILPGGILDWQEEVLA